MQHCCMLTIMIRTCGSLGCKLRWDVLLTPPRCSAHHVQLPVAPTVPPRNASAQWGTNDAATAVAAADTLAGPREVDPIAVADRPPHATTAIACRVHGACCRRVATGSGASVWASSKPATFTRPRPSVARCTEPCGCGFCERPRMQLSRGWNCLSFCRSCCWSASKSVLLLISCEAWKSGKSMSENARCRLAARTSAASARHPRRLQKMLAPNVILDTKVMTPSRWPQAPVQGSVAARHPRPSASRGLRRARGYPCK